MPKKRFQPEDIIGKLRHADILLGQGKKVAEVRKAVGVHRGARPPAPESLAVPTGVPRALPALVSGARLNRYLGWTNPWGAGQVRPIEWAHSDMKRSNAERGGILLRLSRAGTSLWFRLLTDQHSPVLMVLHRRCSQIFRLFISLNTYLAINRVFRLQNIRCVKSNRPWIALKYVGDYLGRSFSYRCRASMLMYHYKFLNDYFNKECITNILNGQIVLWEKSIGNDLFSISLCYPRYDMEGELSLAFNANYQELYIMSFAIIPDNLMHLSDEPIIFVTEVKGMRRRFELIRYSTRVLNDITPPVILATAVQAIATTLGIKSIAGIAAQEQMTAGGEQDIGRWVPTYDELWISMGGKKLNEQAFYFAATPESKPITMVKISHRCRTKRKRQFKNDIYDDVIGTFQEKCLRQGQTLQVTPE